MSKTLMREKLVMRFVAIGSSLSCSFGKAKGKFGQKGKPGKGNLVRSHLTQSSNVMQNWLT